MDTAIRLTDVTKRFTGSAAPAVTNLSLDIPQGSITVLVGPSGCGKTTVLRMINRLEEPTNGTITIHGDNIENQPVHELRRRIGYVIQQTGLFPHRVVADNIATVPTLLGWPKRQIRRRVTELAELVGLAPDLLDRYPAALSGGQQQRVGVARALAADPPILLMDEPYSAVDPIVRQHLQDELLALQDKVGKTIVLVTHDVDEAVRLADRLAVVNTGGIIEQFDSPANVLKHPAGTFVEQFLGAERGLRRMALIKVSDIPMGDNPVVAASTSPQDARGAMDAAGTPWVVVTDGQSLLGWVSRSDLNGQATVADAPVHQLEATVRPDTALREALDAVVTSPIRATAVVTDDNRFVGLLTIDDIGEGLQT